MPDIRSDDQPAPRSLSSKASWILAGRLIAFVLTFITPLVIARRMDLETMGVYKQLFIVIFSATSYLPMGFGTCAFYFLPRERDRQRQVVFNIVLVMSGAGLFGSFIALAFPQIYAKLLGAPSLTQYAGYVALAIPLAIMCQCFEAILVA